MLPKCCQATAALADCRQGGPCRQAALRAEQGLDIARGPFVRRAWDHQRAPLNHTCARRRLSRRRWLAVRMALGSVRAKRSDRNDDGVDQDALDIDTVGVERLRVDGASGVPPSATRISWPVSSSTSLHQERSGRRTLPSGSVTRASTTVPSLGGLTGSGPIATDRAHRFPDGGRCRSVGLEGTPFDRHDPRDLVLRHLDPVAE